MRTGKRNLITDVAGLRVGNACDGALKSGVSVLLGEAPFVASVAVMGGAPGTRETDLLAPDKLVENVDALVLSGGSAFGLAACDGVAEGLRSQGRGFAVGDIRVPIVPGAILFDLTNGGDKGWGTNPYPALGHAALQAAGESFDLGSRGAGTGALTLGLKGGLGSASVILDCGHTVGALVAVNSLGSVIRGDGPGFWASDFEIGDEFGGLGARGSFDPVREFPMDKGLGAATTIAIVATDAALSKAGCQRMAVAAHDGLARAILPSHTPLDGDLVFAVSTGARALDDPLADAFALGHAAALCLSRAVARAVYEARPQPGDILPTWREKFPA